MADVRTELSRVLFTLCKKRKFRTLEKWEVPFRDYEDLRKAGFVTRSKDGDWLIYTVTHRAEEVLKKIKYRG